MKRNFFHLLYIGLVLIILAVPALGMLVTGPSQAGANEVLAAAPSLRNRDGRFNTGILSAVPDYMADRSAPHLRGGQGHPGRRRLALL